MDGTTWLRQRAATDRILRALGLPASTIAQPVGYPAWAAANDRRKRALMDQLMGPVVRDADGYCITCGEYAAGGASCARACPSGDGFADFLPAEAIDTAARLTEDMGEAVADDAFAGFDLWLMARDVVAGRRLHAQAGQVALARVDGDTVELFSMAVGHTIRLTRLWVDGTDCGNCGGTPDRGQYAGEVMPGCPGCDADHIRHQHTER